MSTIALEMHEREALGEQLQELALQSVTLRRRLAAVEAQREVAWEAVAELRRVLDAARRVNALDNAYGDELSDVLFGSTFTDSERAGWQKHLSDLQAAIYNLGAAVILADKVQP